MQGDQLNDIIGAIYDAAASDLPAREAWTAVARLVESHTGGACMLSQEDETTGSAQVTVAPSIDVKFRRAYESQQAGQSPWVRALWRRTFPAVVTDIDAEGACDRFQPLTRTPFYQDWMQPQRFRHTVASGVMRDGRAMLVLKTLLPPETPPTAAHVSLHSSLQPHLHRAARLHRVDHQRDAAVRAAEAAMQSLRVAVLLVQRQDARVTFMNQVAADLLAQGDGLAVDEAGCLSCPPSPAATSHLRALLRESASPTTPTMRIKRETGAADLHLLVHPHAVRDELSLAPPTATVLVTDPSHSPHLSPVAWRALARLTAAEARVVAALAQGNSIVEAARALGVADATVRHHLKQVYAKTCTHRQADLVRLVLADPLMHDEPRS